MKVSEVQFRDAGHRLTPRSSAGMDGIPMNPGTTRENANSPVITTRVHMDVIIAMEDSHFRAAFFG